MTATTRTSSTAAGIPLVSDERWTSYAATVLTICILGWAFDIYEATIMQLVTPILIKEWGITPATMGTVTTVSRWVGLIGTFVFPALADLYGRKPALVWSILGYSILTGLTGFSTGWVSLLIFSSLTRIALAGENPVGILLVTETAPKKWRATALGGLVGGYPLGFGLKVEDQTVSHRGRRYRLDIIGTDVKPSLDQRPHFSGQQKGLPAARAAAESKILCRNRHGRLRFGVSGQHNAHRIVFNVRRDWYLANEVH